MGITTPSGLDLIDAGVGGIERAGDRVEADFAFDLAFEFSLKSGGVDRGSDGTSNCTSFNEPRIAFCIMGWCSPSSNCPRPRFSSTWISSRPTSRAWPRASRNPVKSLRPHAKAHKCVEIAKRQIAAGAIGVCVATVAEAELMAGAGIPGLLLTSPVADPVKMARIVNTGAMVVVDHLQQVAWYDQAAGAAGKKLDVLVDLDVGDHRTGARSPEDAAEIAEAVDQAANLELRGLQAYSVLGSHAGGLEERKRVSAGVVPRGFARPRYHAAPRAFDRDRHRRQHRDLGDRHGGSGSNGTAGRIVRADGSGLSPRGS